MTGEVSTGAGDGPGSRLELRASHEDRDRAVEILRVAAGDGRLTAAELDERVGAALTARTRGELAALTADLPAVPGQAGSAAAQAKDLVRLDYQGGNATRRGQWVVPARMEIRAVGGTVKLDFTDAVITQPTLQIHAYVRGGGLVLVTKPGIEVDADGITVHGGTVKIRPRNGWKEPVHLTVEVSGENHGGRVTARPPRRTFRQWLLRRPGPHARSFRDLHSRHTVLLPAAKRHRRHSRADHLFACGKGRPRHRPGLTPDQAAILLVPPSALVTIGEEPPDPR